MPQSEGGLNSSSRDMLTSFYKFYGYECLGVVNSPPILLFLLFGNLLMDYVKV